MPLDSKVVEKIVSKATNAYVQPSDTLPYRMVFHAYENDSFEVLLKAATVNEDILSYILSLLEA